MAVSFSQRSNDVEIMDDLDCHEDVVFQTLRELDFINAWLGGNAVTLGALEKIWKTIPEGKPISIADLGCGSGEMLRLIATRAIRQNKTLQLTGVDANPHIIKYAQKHVGSFATISFETLNIFSADFLTQTHDVVIATLFLHHFSDEELVSLLSTLKKQTRIAIIVNDIHRHPLAYYSIKWLAAAFSKSSMVKFDAPLSVLRAFKRKELQAILQRAGIKTYKLKWKWAFRWQLIVFCGKD